MRIATVLLASLLCGGAAAQTVVLSGRLGDKVKQPLKVKAGIDSDTARKLQQLIKGSKLKVQAAIQGDTVRVTGAKRDDLQAAIALIRQEVSDLPLTFGNFRD